MFVCTVLNIVFVVAFLQIVFCESELITAVALFRHGARNLLIYSPKDPYNNVSYWPGGFGALTKKGRLESYKLGKWLRQRYNDILPNEYHPEDIYVRSTGKKRTLETASLVAAGLYYEEVNLTQDFFSSVKYIPVNTTEPLSDPVLQLFPVCPVYDQNLKKKEVELTKAETFSNITENLQKFYEYVADNSNTSVNSLFNVGRIHDGMLTEIENNLTLPQWAQEVLPEMRKIALQCYQMFCSTRPLARFRIGPFFNEILDHFTKVATSVDAGFNKLRLYSGHDTIITNVLVTLKAWDCQFVAYNSAILVELYRSGQRYSLRWFYRHEGEVEAISIPDCGFDCDLDKFKELYQDILMTSEEWHRECFENQFSTLEIVLILVIIILVIIIAVSIFVRCKVRCSSSYDQHGCRYNK